MSRTMELKPWIFYLMCVVLVGALSANGYLYYELDKLKLAYFNLENTLALERADNADKLAQADFTIEALSEELHLTAEELDEVEDDYRKEKRKNEEFEEEYRETIEVVRDLDKLSRIDEELLAKYSRVYFLNENYIPTDVDKIDDDYVLGGNQPQFFHGQGMEFLEDLMDEAEEDNIDLKIASAYRSFEHQAELKGQYTQVYGSGANTFSADQGYSEHQLGTTIDLTTPEVGGLNESFADTEAYEWLEDNAYKYGFVLSYPEGNEFYVFEPWHWRFVGRDLARDLHRDDAHFYDWDQREIDKYRLEMFD